MNATASSKKAELAVKHLILFQWIYCCEYSARENIISLKLLENNHLTIHFP